MSMHTLTGATGAVATSDGRISRSRWPLALNAFQLKQTLLPMQTAAVSSQPAIGTDHPVAGNDDRDRICAAGAANRAHSFGATNLSCDPSIGARLTAWDCAECAPDFSLKRRANRKIERNVESNGVA